MGDHLSRYLPPPKPILIAGTTVGTEALCYSYERSNQLNDEAQGDDVI